MHDLLERINLAQKAIDEIKSDIEQRSGRALSPLFQIDRRIERIGKISDKSLLIFKDTPIYSLMLQRREIARRPLPITHISQMLDMFDKQLKDFFFIN